MACTSAKFVQLNSSDGFVFGFGFRKEDDRQAFQNTLQVRILLKIIMFELITDNELMINHLNNIYMAYSRQKRTNIFNLLRFSKGFLVQYLLIKSSHPES